MLQSTSLSTAFATDLLPPKCWNEGLPLGDRCECPSPYMEPFCKEARNEVTVVMITVTVNIFVKVVEKNFTSEMAIPGSPAFRSFVAHFKQQMNIFYANISGYQKVIVMSLSKGSINVDHQVVLRVPFSKYQASYEAAVDEIQAKMHSKEQVCTSESKEKLCFNASDSRVTKVPLSPEDLFNTCRNNSVIQQKLQPFYLARNLSNQLQCVSNCSFFHPDPFRCENGNCYIQTNGPNCYCQQSDAYWYTGRHCDQSISKVGVAVGVALGLAVLLLVILLLAALLCWQRRRSRKDPRSLDLNPSEKLYENEPEWGARPQGLPPQSPPAQQQQPGPSASTSQEDASPKPTQGSFQPQLDQVDTSLQVQKGRGGKWVVTWETQPRTGREAGRTATFPGNPEQSGWGVCAKGVAVNTSKDRCMIGGGGMGLQAPGPLGRAPTGFPCPPCPCGGRAGLPS
uniref:SEA domain-containing protein n=1 Tax=Laticauda laticaudata TaxID=8630 RepID=A0A8C5S1U2_LATLA